MGESPRWVLGRREDSFQGYGGLPSLARVRIREVLTRGSRLFGLAAFEEDRHVPAFPGFPEPVGYGPAVRWEPVQRDDHRVRQSVPEARRLPVATVYGQVVARGHQPCGTLAGLALVPMYVEYVWHRHCPIGAGAILAHVGPVVMVLREYGWHGRCYTWLRL